MYQSTVCCPRCDTVAEAWKEQHLDGKRVYACPSCRQRCVFSTSVTVFIEPPSRLPYVPVTSLDVGKEVIVVEARGDGYYEWPVELRGTITAVDAKRFYVRVELPDGNRALTLSRKTGVETRMYKMSREVRRGATWFEVDGGEDPEVMEGIAAWP